MYCLFFFRYILLQLRLQVQRKMTYTVLTYYSSGSDFPLPKEFIGSSFVMNVFNFLSFKKKNYCNLAIKFVLFTCICLQCVHLRQCVWERERDCVYVWLCVCVAVMCLFQQKMLLQTHLLSSIFFWINAKCPEYSQWQSIHSVDWCKLLQSQHLAAAHQKLQT